MFQDENLSLCFISGSGLHFYSENFDFLLLLQVIAAEGEMNASRALKEASLVIAESPSALQLRYLQTLNTIAAEKNSTIIFPLPLEMMQGFMKH